MFTEKELAVCHHEGALYISRTMPLFVALRRFTTNLEANHDTPLEQPEYLQAKALMLVLQDYMDGENTGDDLEKFETLAEGYYDCYAGATEKMIPPKPAETA